MNCVNKVSASLVLFTLLFGNIAPFVAAAPIDSVEKYAWSDVVGWISFNPINGGVDVSDTSLNGSAWIDNHGWINLQPTTSGVDNTVVDDISLGCIGDLSGYAWNTHLGWLNFEDVYIDSNGDLQGTASGTLFGNVSFQGINYGVNTSWRPDCVAPSAPGTLDLLTSSDTSVGSGSTDNITSQTLPSFALVCTESPSTLTLYSETGVIATHSCTSTGSVDVTSTVVLSEGAHSITYTETDPSNHVSPASASLNITIDTTLPNISITAPTKLDNASITDTTFTLTDTNGVDINSIVLGTGSLSTSGLSCTPASGIAASVTCSVSINTSGNFSVTSSDVAGNTRTVYENNYIIDTLAPSTPTVTIDTSAGINTPTLTFASTDNIAIAYYEIEYLADDAGSGTGTPMTLTGTTSPQTLSLDPDTLTHTVRVRAYDTAGNMSESIITLPLLVTFTVPTPISNTSINDATVTISNPNNNPLTNIALTPGTTTASLGTCTGSGSDMSDPYESPVICTLTGIANTGTIAISAEDSITGAKGQNTQSFVIETTLPTISITAPTKIDNAAITDTSITIMDDTGILAAAVSLSSSTSGYSNLICTQTNPTRVDCTVQVDSSGNIEVSVNDRAGNTQSQSEIGYIIDTVPPIVTINSPVIAYSENQGSYPVSGTCSIGDGNVTITLVGATPNPQSVACTPSGTWSTVFDVSSISDGIGTLAIGVVQTDGAGNTGLSGGTFVDKDATAPISPTVVSLSPNPVSTGTTVTLSLSGVEAGATVSVPNMKCTPNPAGNDGLVSCTATASTILLNGGNNTITITDTVGNKNTNIEAPILTIQSIFSSSGGASSSGPKYDRCNGNDTSGSIYDGKCSKEIISSLLPSETIPSETIEIPEEDGETTDTVLEENIPLSAEEEGYMEKEVDGKKVGYTIENTFESCYIVDALNEEIIPYPEDFFEDIKLSFYRDTINAFAGLSIVQGNTDGLFEPTREITRAEFTKLVLISHCYNYQEEDTKIRKFHDVQENTWEARVVSKAEKLGIINGYSDGSFKPNQIITKVEATKILMRIAMIQSNSLENLNYTDISVDWHKKYVQTGETLGIFDAEQDNSTFHPDSGVKREEMVDMIYRIVDLYR